MLSALWLMFVEIFSTTSKCQPLCFFSVSPEFGYGGAKLTLLCQREQARLTVAIMFEWHLEASWSLYSTFFYVQKWVLIFRCESLEPLNHKQNKTKINASTQIVGMHLAKNKSNTCPFFWMNYIPVRECNKNTVKVQLFNESEPDFFLLEVDKFKADCFFWTNAPHLMMD